MLNYNVSYKGTIRIKSSLLDITLCAVVCMIKSYQKIKIKIKMSWPQSITHLLQHAIRENQYSHSEDIIKVYNQHKVHIVTFPWLPCGGAWHPSSSIVRLWRRLLKCTGFQSLKGSVYAKCFWPWNADRFFKDPSLFLCVWAIRFMPAKVFVPASVTNLLVYLTIYTLWCLSCVLSGYCS